MAVRIHTDDPRRFEPSATVLVGGSPEEAVELRISASRPHRGGLLVSFETYEDRDRAERLRGKLVFAHGGEPPAVEGFLESDLRGLVVVDPSGGRLGVIAAVHVREAQDLWEVQTEEGASVLLPAVEEFVKEVDLKRGRVVAEPPDGLFPHRPDDPVGTDGP